MDLKKYIYGHCVHPVRVRVWDTFSNSYVFKEMPCGHCLHCRNTRVNEWVTRLYSELKYSAHCYYITLDYAPFSYEKVQVSDLAPAPALLARETAAVWHNLNKNHRYGLQPLVLCKNHLQDFFKRFRKNTGIKIQYFSCGEYGTKAEGSGYGRPHFHVIVFSNYPITCKQFEDAWTIDGYKIGRVDYNDLVLNGTTNANIKNGLNSKFVFRYVCKYLQKGNFDFESLSTIAFHRAYFESINKILFNIGDGDPDWSLPKDAGEIKLAWKQYIKNFSPFTCCSKRPCIGFKYFEENKARFTQRDFRLFGLPNDCVAFPAYFTRKVKEGYSAFVALGEDSQKPTTSSRVGYILSILKEIYNERTKIENLGISFIPRWCCCSEALKRGETIVGDYSPNDLYFHEFGIVKQCSLHMYDVNNSTLYQFNGYGYILWHKYNNIGFVKVGYMDIIDVINMVQPSYMIYFENYVVPMHMQKVLQENELVNTIETLYKGNTYEDKFRKFREDVYALYQDELAGMYKDELIKKNYNQTL